MVLCINFYTFVSFFLVLSVSSFTQPADGVALGPDSKSELRNTKVKKEVPKEQNIIQPKDITFVDFGKHEIIFDQAHEHAAHMDHEQKPTNWVYNPEEKQVNVYRLLVYVFHRIHRPDTYLNDVQPTGSRQIN